VNTNNNVFIKNLPEIENNEEELAGLKAALIELFEQ